YTVVDDTGLTGGNPLLRAGQHDLHTFRVAAQEGRARLARRAHAHGHLQALGRQVVERRGAEPVDVAQPDALGAEHLARADDDAALLRIELEDEQRLADRQAETAPLADGVV